jgi:hypothetical protein
MTDEMSFNFQQALDRLGNQERFYFQNGYTLPEVSVRRKEWFCLGHGLVIHCCSAGPTYGRPKQLHAVPESRRRGQHGLFGFVLHAPRYDEIETVVQSLLELEEPQS